MSSLMERAFNALPESMYETAVGRYLIRETQFTPEAVAERYLYSMMLGWDLLKGKRILDLGACTGGFAKIAAEHGVEVVSLDKDPESSRKEFARGRKIETGIEYNRADMRRLPFAANSFDAVISVATVHWAVKNLRDLEDMLSESSRITRDGGFFRFTPGNFGNLTIWAQLFDAPVPEWSSPELRDRAKRIGAFAGGVSTDPIHIMHHHVRKFETDAKIISMIDIENGGYDPVFWHIAYGNSEFNTLRLFY